MNPAESMRTLSFVRWHVASGANHCLPPPPPPTWRSRTPWAKQSHAWKRLSEALLRSGEIRLDEA